MRQACRGLVGTGAAGRLQPLRRSPGPLNARPAAERFSPLRRSTAFTVRANETWDSDDLQLRSVRIHQEATDWEKQVEFGMGSVVWDCALTFCDLAEALEAAQPGFWRGKAILELGAGCGAPGLTLASLGAEVVLTDRLAVLPLLERNIALNAPISASALPLRWEDAKAADFNDLMPVPDAKARPVDIVLGTDLLEIDPDRSAGQGFFAALCHALAAALAGAPQCLVLLVLEERGLLCLEALGELFVPLLRDGVSLFEAFPPGHKDGQRHLCLHGPQGGDGNFAAWRRALEAHGGHFAPIGDEVFTQA